VASNGKYSFVLVLLAFLIVSFVLVVNLFISLVGFKVVESIVHEATIAAFIFTIFGAINELLL